MGNIGKTVANLQSGIHNLRMHWKTPPEGYQVSYREFSCFSAGAGGVSFISVLGTWTTLAMTTPLILSYFKASSGLLFTLTILSSLIGLLRAPFLSMLLDNSNSSKGKFKPFLPWTAIGTGLCYCAIPFIPQAWIDRILFRFSIPALDLFSVAASRVEVSLGIVVLFLLLQGAGVFHTLLNQALAGIEQTISTVAQERANIGSLKGILGNLPASIVNIVMPLIATAFFAVNGSTGMENAGLYRIFFPVCAVGGLCLLLFTCYGTQERTVVNRQHVNRVRFWDGAKELSKNKYFWIITIFGIMTGLRALANIYFWVCTYAIGGQAGGVAIAVCNTVLNISFIPGMALGPVLVRKFGKRNLLIFSNVMLVAIIFFQLLVLKKPYLVLGGIFFQNLFRGIEFMAGIMVSDVLDYQQYKTGKRLEGFWQNYNNFILTFAGVFTGILMPLALSFAGIGFGDDIDAALQILELMNSAFRNVTILSLIAAVCAMVPMLFYDLTEKKHANYVRALRLRAAAADYQAGCLTPEDAAAAAEIAAQAKENKDPMLLAEIAGQEWLMHQEQLHT